MNIKDEALKYLRLSLADQNADFRDGQWKSIEELLNRKRVLVVQRTGWGKSNVYFLATKLFRQAGSGPTLLISPLLALMRNQLLSAERLKITARNIDSDNKNEWSSIEAELLQNTVDLLMITPERLSNNEFINNVFAKSVTSVRDS
jgi:ATP-dependent DNA helicase RecQ